MMADKKADNKNDLTYKSKLFWKEASDKDKEDAMSFAHGYMDFLGSAKTEFETVSYAVNALETAGFKNIEGINSVKSGDKLYYNFKNRALAAFVVKEKELATGFKLVCSHIDSPRLDLKIKPLIEDDNVCYLKTHYYGGIKKYQWVTRPLAIHGFVSLKSGKNVDVLVGENPDDPVFTITDLLPHLAKEQMKKEATKVIEGEEMRLLMGTIPVESDSEDGDKEDEKESVKKNVLKLLNIKYGIEEEDLISADLRIVPADKPRSTGLDESLILAYGQDDRVCAYTSLKAFIDTADSSKSDKSLMLLYVDKEEIGSEGFASADSDMLFYFVGQLMEKMELSPIDYNVRKVLINSQALSSDVDVLIDPIYPEPIDKYNTAVLGHGGILIKYTGQGGKSFSSEAFPEFMAYLRKIFEEGKVYWQVGTLGKIDKGGGGTIAKYLAKLGIDTVDFGTGLLSMHSPLEVSSKADVYSTYRAYEVFYSSK